MSESALEAKLKELDELSEDPKVDRDEFIRKVETELKPLWEQHLRAQGSLEPDWDPLHKVLPLSQCDGFGFMGYEGEIRVYKQGFTRGFLYIDPTGQTYELDENTFRPIPKEDAIEEAFRGIEVFGFTRETPHNKKNADKRRRIFEKQSGYKVVAFGGEPPE